MRSSVRSIDIFLAWTQEIGVGGDNAGKYLPEEDDDDVALKKRDLRIFQKRDIYVIGKCAS